MAGRLITNAPWEYPSIGPFDFAVTAMNPLTIPPGLLDFLDTKHPVIWGISSLGSNMDLELGAEQELDSEVGVLALRGVHYQEFEFSVPLCRFRLGDVADLPMNCRKAMDETTPSHGGQVFVFEACDGRRFQFVAEGIVFFLKPWFDIRLTQQARQRNAEQGYSAREAVASHFADSDAAPVGKEIICWNCLHRIHHEREYADCPVCGGMVAACSSEQLLKMFFHSNTAPKLYERSKCGILQNCISAGERYRLIVYSYWIEHRIVEVERTHHGARLTAMAWNSQLDNWSKTADGELTPAEWRRFAIRRIGSLLGPPAARRAPPRV